MKLREFVCVFEEDTLFDLRDSRGENFLNSLTSQTIFKNKLYLDNDVIQASAVEEGVVGVMIKGYVRNE